MRKTVLTIVGMAAFLVLSLASARPASAYIYWHSYDSANSRIGRADLNGAHKIDSLVDGIYFGSALAADGAHIYWGESGNNPTMGRLGRATVDGTGVDHAFASAATYCGTFDLKVNRTNLYWLKSTCSGANRAIDFIPKADPALGYNEAGADAGICGFAIDSKWVYWSRGQYIARAPAAGGLPNLTWLDTGSNRAPCALAVNSAHIYWTNTAPEPPGPESYRGRSIGRALINGSEASVDNTFIQGTVFNTGLSLPPGIAVDHDYIYWTNQPDYSMGSPSVYGSIGRAKLDGSKVNQGFVPQVFSPGGITVDRAGPGSSPGGLRITSLRTARSHFIAGRSSTPTQGRTGHGPTRPRGTTGTVFSFSLSRAAGVTTLIRKVRAGRMSRGRCRSPRAGKSGKRCDLTVATLNRTGHADLNTIAFSGKVRGKTLAPGRYRAAFSAKSGSDRSKTVTLGFRLDRH